MRIRAWINDEDVEFETFEVEALVDETATYEHKLLCIALEALNDLGFSIGELVEDE